MFVDLCLSQTVSLFSESFVGQTAASECEGFPTFREISLFPETSENLQILTRLTVWQNFHLILSPRKL